VRLPHGAWRTVCECLSALFPQVPASRWLERFARGRVCDEAGEPLVVDAPYRSGLIVRYWREVADEPAVVGETGIVYRDAHLLIADKPHFLPVMPAGPWLHETLIARLRRDTGVRALQPLHRLDRGTAGLVLCSIDPGTRADYQVLFERRAIAKIYHAKAPPLPQWSFPLVHQSRLVPGEPFFRMREAPGEPNSETRIDVLERGASSWLYELRPVTGRKHQLRVHMASLGAPIENDPWYPALEAEGPDDPQRPLRLLARSLAFVDPLTGTDRHFTSRLTL